MTHKLKKPILWLAIVFPFVFFYLNAQTTPMPTSPYGTNSVEYYAESGGDYGYYFKFNGTNIYKYSIPNSSTFHGIMAIDQTNPNNVFLPSNYGGPIFQIPDHDAKMPWHPDISYNLVYSGLSGNIVTTIWEMIDAESNTSTTYQYQLYISGRTLVIKAQELDMTSNTVGFTLDRSEWCVSPNIVKIPNLPLFNLLFCNGSFTSLFFDWEQTKCSSYNLPDISINGMGTVISQTSPSSVEVSPSSVVYTPTITYKRTMNQYNPPQITPPWSRPSLDETIYLTVAPNLSDALPNLVSPPGHVANISAAMSKTVLFYCSPYTYLQNPDQTPPEGMTPYPANYRLLDVLKGQGIDNLSVIIQWYQRFGMDQNLPNVLDDDGNPFSFNQNSNWSFCNPVDPTPAEGRTSLLNLRDYVVNTLNYGFALHQNYFENGLTASTTYDVQYPDGSFARGNQITDCSTVVPAPYIFKPSLVQSYADEWNTTISSIYHPTWTYLDIQSSNNLLTFADFDNKSPGAGSSLYMLKKYRDVALSFSSSGLVSNNGPVLGEGGFHFLFAGYYDSFEGRIQTADANVRGINAPLLVDFDLEKMHGKSAQHGPGHSDTFLNQMVMNGDDILAYVATELAYGHGGLITERGFGDHTVEHANFERTHVFPMQIAYATAKPVSIKYFYGSNGTPLSASEYIAMYPNYDVFGNPHFMGKVRIEYDNGVIVCVNRSGSVWNNITLGTSGGWFCYNSSSSQGVNAGITNNNTFTLPANGGWVCYNPIIMLAASITGPTDVYHPGKGGNNSYNWTAAPTGGTAPFTYLWKKNGASVGTNSSTYTGTFSYDGGGGVSVFSLSVTITDSKGYVVSNSLSVNEHHSQEEELGKNGEALDITTLQIPAKYFIKQNFPNPFNPTTTISYGIPEASYVKIGVFDGLGRELEQLVNKEQQPGYYNIDFDAHNLSGGVYYYKITTAKYNETRKMILLK